MSNKARDIKERTLAMEVRHASMSGGTFRDAETANIRNPERMEARARAPKPVKQKPKRREFKHREITKAELAAANVTRKPAKPQKLSAPPCKFCGLCRWCWRFQRSQLIMRKAREGDVAMLRLTMELVGLALAAQQKSDYKDALGREYPFSRIKGHTANRAVNAGIESVCDRSVTLLGAWLR